MYADSPPHFHKSIHLLTALISTNITSTTLHQLTVHDKPCIMKIEVWHLRFSDEADN